MSQAILSRSPYRPTQHRWVPGKQSLRDRQELMNSGMRRFRRTRVTPIKWKMQFGPATLVVGLIAMGIALSMLYLLHFNQVATKGYDLKRLEVDRQHLLDQNQLSNTNIDRVKSMPTILQSTRIQSMVKAGEISFVRGDTALAKADVGS